MNQTVFRSTLKLAILFLVALAIFIVNKIWVG